MNPAHTALAGRLKMADARSASHFRASDGISWPADCSEFVTAWAVKGMPEFEYFGGKGWRRYGFCRAVCDCEG